MENIEQFFKNDLNAQIKLNQNNLINYNSVKPVKTSQNFKSDIRTKQQNLNVYNESNTLLKQIKTIYSIVTEYKKKTGNDKINYGKDKTNDIENISKIFSEKLYQNLILLQSKIHDKMSDYNAVKNEKCGENPIKNCIDILKEIRDYDIVKSDSKLSFLKETLNNDNDLK